MSVLKNQILIKFSDEQVDQIDIAYLKCMKKKEQKIITRTEFIRKCIFGELKI